MANGDHIRFDASFAELDQYTARAKALLEEQLQKAVALGDEALASQIRSQQAKLGGGTRNVAGVRETISAIEQENVALQRGVQLELFKLEALQKQNEAYLSQKAYAEGVAQRPLFEEPMGHQPLITPAGSASATAAAEAQQRLLAELQEETTLRREAFDLEQRQLASIREQGAAEATYVARLAEADRLGRLAGGQGGTLGAGRRASLGTAPMGMAPFSAKQQGAIESAIVLGEYKGAAAAARVSNDELGASFTRLGMQESEASNALRRHGALTTEYLQALARGETTVSEFGYQVGATVGKFAGWTAAAGATYAVLGGIAELGRGAIDASSGVQQLTRTLDQFKPADAAAGLENLSAATNVSMKEASDATFLASRTFHQLDDALTAAKNGLSVFKLDNVSLTDSMQLSTSVLQQFGLTAREQGAMWNMLAAGQREYNARISQTVPLLRTATGAVHTAGGDLNQLIQLSVLATRVYPGMGGQIGTAFARGATTYTPKNLKDLQGTFGIGLGAEANNWTQLLQHAILASADMTQQQRIRLASDIFDPRFGSRVAGLFGPQAAATLRREQSGRQAITPGATQGALQKELEQQLGTTRERMHAFTNELQRLGAAAGTSGAVGAFNFALTGVVKTLELGRGAAEGFARLPGPMKDTVLALEALTAGFLVLTRTRIGGSFADLTGLSRVGLGPSATRRATSDLRVGTRAAQEAIQAEIAGSSSKLLQLGAQRATLAKQIADVNEEEGVGSTRARDLQLKNLSLEQQQTRLQAERNAQLQVQADLTTQQMKLRKGQYSKDEIAALRTDPSIGTKIEDEATQTGGVLTRAGRGLKSMGSGLANFILGLDPLMVAMIGLPIVLGEFSKGLDSLKQADQQASSALNAPMTDLQSVYAASRQARQGGRREERGASGPLGDFVDAYQGYSYISKGANREAQGKELRALGDFYNNTSSLFAKDADALAGTEPGRKRIYEISQQMKQRVGMLLKGSGLPQSTINNFYRAYTTALQNDYNAALTRAQAHAGGPSLYQIDMRLPSDQLTKQITAMDDYQKVFGENDKNLQQSLTAFAALATKGAAPGQQGNDKLMQQLTQAQSSVVSTVTKQTTDFVHAASLATTYRGQLGDLTSALSGIQNVQGQLQQLMSRFKNAPKVLAALQQLMGLVGDQAKQVQQQMLQAMQAHAAVATSAIQGISPEADIARAQSDVSHLTQQVAFGQAHHFDASTMDQLQNTLNTARNTLYKTTTDNARSILEARGKLTESSIMGLDPAADIARARVAVTDAGRLLQFDRTSGAGTAKLLSDQADLASSEYQLRQQMQQRDQQVAQDAVAFIDAQAKLAESQTTDPVAIARDELNAARRTLATIRPQDYKTQQEYQTALLNQQAQVANAAKNVTSQTVSTRMDTLKYELHTQQITDQQYIDGLNKLLQLHKLSQQDIQRIRSEIYDTAHSTAVNLNVGNIKLPTTYEVRRAIAGAMRRGALAGASAQAGTVVQSSVTNHISIVQHISVARDSDVKRVGDSIAHALRTNTQGLAQAAGVI